MPNDSRRPADPLGPLTLATIVTLVIIGVIAFADLSDDGKVDPMILAMLGGAASAIVGVFAARYRRNGRL